MELQGVDLEKYTQRHVESSWGILIPPETAYEKFEKGLLAYFLAM